MGLLRWFSRRAAPWMGVALAFAGVSCGDPLGPDEDVVDAVQVSPASVQLTAGETRQITVRVTDVDGAVLPNRPVFWSSQAPLVATVSQGGLITAVAAGSAQIAASAGGKSGIVSVTVASRPVTQVRVTPSTAALQVGATTTLSAAATDATGGAVTGRPVIWSSSSEAIATVSSTGLVSGVSAGTVTVTATVDGASGTAVVTITPVPVATVTVSPQSGSVTVGNTLQLSATTASATGQTLSGRIVSWSSSNPQVASVSSTGLVTAIGAGTVTITATSEGRSGTAQLDIAPVPVALLRITPSTATLTPGQAVQLTAQAFDAGGNLLNRTVTWSSAQPAIATVSTSGLVSAVSAGQVRITAAIGPITETAIITVAQSPVARISVSPARTSLLVSATQQLTASLFDVDGNPLSGRSITWITGAPSVATVSQTGLVTALASGSAVIFAASEGQSGSATIDVSTVAVRTVSIAPPNGTIQQGQTLQLSASAVDASGNPVTGRPIVWASSNEAIATVSSTGRVVGITPGSVTITATIDGVTGAGIYTVTQVPVAAVQVAPTTATLSIGGTQALTVSLFDGTGNPLSTVGRTITFSTNQPTVATVSPTGMVTGVAQGAATITVVCEGRTAQMVVNVSPVAVATVVLIPASVTLGTGGTQSIQAEARDASGNVLTGRPVTWSSSNPTVATVVTSTTGPTNTITAVAQGSAVISAVISGITGVASATITQPPVASIAITGPTTVVEGASVSLSATMLDGSGNPITGPTVAWSSSNPLVSVSASGVVTAVVNSAGQSATITASAPNAGAGGSTPSTTHAVTVSFAPVAAVVLNPAAPNVSIGNTTSLLVALSAAGGASLNTTGRTVTWSSLDPSLATVSTGGVVTGVALGTARIVATASSPGQSAPFPADTVLVTINAVPVATVTVTPSPATVHVGSLYKRTFTAVTRDAAGNILTGRSITWTSVNQTVATVDALTGEVTAVSVGGPVVIRATSEGVNGDAQVTTDLVAVSTVVLSPTSATLHPTLNPTQTFAAQPRDSAGNVISGAALGGRTTTWTSSAPTIASVSSAGLVTALSGGSATITASIGGQPGTASVQVLTPVASMTAAFSPDSLILPGSVNGIATLRSAANVPLQGRTVAISSLQPAIATVTPASATSNASGQVALTATGVSSGTATIRLVSEGVTQDIIVRVLAPVASVSVTAPTDSVIGTTGGPVAATATLRDAANLTITGRPVTWTSSNTSVATVSATGVVTPVGAGSTVITATSEGVSGTLTFRVLAPVASVTVGVPQDSTFTGTTLQATVTLRDAANNILTGRAVTWASSNATVASVSSTGLVSGLTAGNTNISATSEGISSNQSVKVLARITAIVITPPTDSIIGSGSLALSLDASTATGNAQNRLLTLTSSATGVATVAPGSVITSGAGKANFTVTYVAPGTSTITVAALAEGFSVTRVVRMLAPVATVQVTTPGDSIIGTGTLQAAAVLRDAANNVLTGRPVVWASRTTSVATVNSSGLITALTPGTTRIVAVSEGQADSLTIRVLPAISTLTVTTPDSSLYISATAQATAVARDAANNILTGRLLTWSSTVPAKASVSTAGLITAVDTGTTTVTVSAEGKTASVPIVVTLVPAATVTITPATLTDTVGKTRTFTAVARDSAGGILTGRTFSWSSSNGAKLSINSTTGLATFADSGSAVVTATTSPGTGTGGVASGTSSVTLVLAPVATVSVPGTLTVGLASSTDINASVIDNRGFAATGRACTISTANAAQVGVSPTAALTSPTGTLTITISGVSATGSTPVVVTITCEGKQATVSVTVQ